MRPIEMKYVEDRKSRRIIFKKRSKSLKKKAYELTKLCDIPALMICYSEEGEAITWPENKQEIEQIAEKFRRRTFYQRRTRQIYQTLCNFRNIEMMKERIEAAERKARELPAEKVNELRQSVESKLKEVQERINFLAPQSVQSSNDYVTEASINEAETVNDQDNVGREGTQLYVLDLNEPPAEEDEQNALAIVPFIEQDVNRMMHHSMAMEAYNWHLHSMNYWASQLAMYQNLDSSNLDISSNLAPLSSGSLPAPCSLNFIPPSPPPPPKSVLQYMLMLHGMQSGNGDVASESNNNTNI